MYAVELRATHRHTMRAGAVARSSIEFVGPLLRSTSRLREDLLALVTTKTTESDNLETVLL